MFFEGSEKKVELVTKKRVGSLRSFGDEFWGEVVKACEAQIISKLENDLCVAYLLSESSLFVYDNNFVMITCGRTNLVRAVEHFCEQVQIEDIENFFYERKHEVFPRRQPTSFTDDISYLNQFIPGQALQFGDEAGHYISLYCMDKSYQPEKSDITLEVLMHGIRNEASKIFGCSSPESRKRISSEVGVCSVIPGFKVDEYFFEPAGYSLNAIKGNNYYTFHVTPQQVGSYVSFEANYSFLNSQDLGNCIDRVIKIFQPESVDVFLFAPHENEFKVSLEGYNLKQHVTERVQESYQVCFYQYDSPFTGTRKAQKIEIQ